VTVDQFGARHRSDRRRLVALVALATSAEPLHAQDGARLVERARLRVGGGPVEVLARSPRGDLLATAGSEQVAVWEMREDGPRELSRFSTASHVEHLAFDPSGSRLAISGGVLQLWERASGALSDPFRPWRGGPIAWSPDGRFLAAYGVGDRVELLETEQFATVRSLGLGATRSGVGAFLWEPDGGALWIAVPGKHAQPLRYELASGVFDVSAGSGPVLDPPRKTPAGLDVGFDAEHPLGEHSLAFTPDERFALLANDARVAVLELESGVVRELAVGGSICAGRAGAEFLIAEPNGLALWDAALGERRQRFERGWKAQQRPSLLALGPGAETCFAGGVNRRTWCFDLSGAQPDRDAGVFSSWAIDCSRDGERWVFIRCLSSPGLPMPSGMRLMERGQWITPLETERWPSATAACFSSEGDLFWSNGGWGGAEAGTWFRAWPEGAPSKLNDRRYYALRSIGAEYLVGIDLHGLDLVRVPTGRVIETYEPARLRSWATRSLAVSPSGRWVLVLAGREARLLELLR
jgi:hypothetical protein